LDSSLEKGRGDLGAFPKNPLLNVNVQQAIENLDDAFEWALINVPTKFTSGLVEMQRWFTQTLP
jgi:hypothetical protein